MRVLLVLALVLGTSLALVPEADARQFCTYGGSDPCDDKLVCVWNRLESRWTCWGEMGCDPWSCDPYRP